MKNIKNIETDFGEKYVAEAMGFTGISIVPRYVLGNGFKAPSDIFNLNILEKLYLEV